MRYLWCFDPAEPIQCFSENQLLSPDLLYIGLVWNILVKNVRKKSHPTNRVQLTGRIGCYKTLFLQRKPRWCYFHLVECNSRDCHINNFANALCIFQKHLILEKSFKLKSDWKCIAMAIGVFPSNFLINSITTRNPDIFNSETNCRLGQFRGFISSWRC